MRNVMKIGVGITILTVFILTACGVMGGDTDSRDSAEMESKTWVLISYGAEGRLQAVLEGVEITVTFDPDEAVVRGSSGCNQYFGDYVVTGSEFSLSNIAFTEMACLTPEGVMDQEQEFLSILAAAESYEVQEELLTIYCAEGQILKFK